MLVSYDYMFEFAVMVNREIMLPAWMHIKAIHIFCDESMRQHKPKRDNSAFYIALRAAFPAKLAYAVSDRWILWEMLQ